MHYNYIAIEGNIGAGKTTLASRLSQDLSSQLILEEFEDNPFLKKFYEDKEQFAFHAELSFLVERFKQLKRYLVNERLSKQNIVSDYFVDKCFVFAKSTLKNEELELYLNLFNMIQNSLPKPDLIVFLQKDPETLLENISKRGRPYEKNITLEYLNQINQSYLAYFKNVKEIPILLLDTRNIDFVNHDVDYQKMKDLILNKYTNGINRLKP